MVVVADIHLERSPGAPLGVNIFICGRILRIQHRDAPQIVGAVVENGRAVGRDERIDVKLWRYSPDARIVERVGLLARKRRHTGIPNDIGCGRRHLRNLQPVGGGRLVFRSEAERRLGRIDRRGINRRDRRGDGSGRVVPYGELANLLVVRVDRVADRLNGYIHRLGIIGEIPPVKAGIGRRNYLGRRECTRFAKVNLLRVDSTLVAIGAVDRSADNLDHAKPIGIRLGRSREVEVALFEGQFDHSAVEADFDIAGDADLAVGSRGDERVEALLETGTWNNGFNDSVDRRGCDRKGGVRCIERRTVGRKRYAVGSADAVYLDADVRHGSAAIRLIGGFAGNAVHRAGLGPVVPAVAILVKMGIVDVGIGRDDIGGLFPPGLHEVVVARHLAIVGVLGDTRIGNHREVGLEEVVDNRTRHTVGIGRICVRRIEQPHALVKADMVYQRDCLRLGDRPVAEADEVFLVVRETVVIKVAVGVATVDSEIPLPPVGNAVAVGVAAVAISRVLGVQQAVGQQTVGERRQILGARSVALRNRPLRDTTVFLVSIAVGSVGSDCPRIFRAQFIPTCSQTLGIDIAQRDKVSRTVELVADIVPCAPDQIIVKLAIRIVSGVILGTRGREINRRPAHHIVGIHRVRELELVYALERHRRVARQILGPEFAVGRLAAERRQMAYGVGNPRDNFVGLVDLRTREHGVLQNRVPPADLDIAVASPHIGVDYGQHIGGEACGNLLHILGLGRARKAVEVVVVHELSRAVLGLECLLAEGLDLLRRVAGHKVLLNVFQGTCAVPDAHFVQTALEEVGGHIAPARGGSRNIGTESPVAECPAAENDNRRIRFELRNRELLDAVTAGILNNSPYSVVGGEGGGRLVSVDAVNHYAKSAAVVSRGNMRPLAVSKLGTLDIGPAVGRIVEFGEYAPVGRNAYCEIVANNSSRIKQVPPACVDCAGDDILCICRLCRLGAHPRLDGKVLQEVGVPRIVVALDGRETYQDALVASIAEGNALTALYFIAVQRIARRLDRAHHLGAIAPPVAVGIITFVLLKVEEEARFHPVPVACPRYSIELGRI